MDLDAIALSRELADRSLSERQEYYVQRAVPVGVRDEVELLLRLNSHGSETSDPDITTPSDSSQRGSGSQGSGGAPSPTAFQPVTIGRYEVICLIGRGGMGEVHLARDPMLDRNVAVKLIGLDLEGDAARKRLVREARAVGRLRHPNIVTIFDAGEYEGRSWIAMEYVCGETMRSLIRRQAPMSLRRKLEFIEGACAGLAHAHHLGVVHLDVKPDNLMMDQNGVVKVLDFGIARVLQGEALLTRHLGGTLGYMSPEQIVSGSVDRRSDIFSLGCSCFEFLTDAPAYTGSMHEIVIRITAGPRPRLVEVRPEIDPRLDAIISRAMAIDPADRYDDLEELRAALGEVRAGIEPVEEENFVVRPTVVIPSNTPASPRASAPIPSHRTSATRPLILSIAALAIVATGVGTYVAWNARVPSESPTASVSAPAPSQPDPPVETAAPTPNTTRDSSDVWRRLATGDRAGVLELLRSASADKDSDLKLPREVLEQVRSSVLRTRASASITVRSSAPYRSAEARLARADRLSADGQPVEALAALWDAADLFAQANTAGQQQPSPAAAKIEPQKSQQPADVSSRAVNPEPPPPLVESPRPEPPATEAAAPRRAPAVESKPEPTQTKTPSETDAVLETIRKYQSAYEALDISAVQHVFPSLGRDQVEQLRKTFLAVSTYSMDVRNPQVRVDSDTATVRAVLVRRIVPRVGRPVANEVDTEFRLRRVGGAWVITTVTAGGA